MPVVGHYGRMHDLNDPRVEAAVEGYFHTLRARNKDAWIALFDKNAVMHEPVGTTPGEGREGLEQVWLMFTGPFAVLEFACDEVFYAGSGAAARWTARTHAPAAPKESFHGITVFEVDAEGFIQTVMSYWDPAAVLIRLAGGSGDDEDQVVEI